MKTTAIFLLLCFVIIPSTSHNKSMTKDDKQTIISNLEDVYGKDNLILAYYSIEELRPYSILQFESTVSKYSKDWVKPFDYTSLLTDKEKSILEQRIIQYIEDSGEEKSDLIMQKIGNYLYTYNTVQNISINNNESQLKSIQTLRSLRTTRTAFENISTLGEFDKEDFDSIEMNQAKVKAFNIVAGLDDKARYIYFSEFFKQYSQL